MLRITAAGILLLGMVTGCVDLTSTGSTDQSDQIRAQVNEGLHIAQQYETPVAEAIVQRQRQDPILSSINSLTLQLRLPKSGKYVDSVTVSSGLIVVRYGRSANGAIAGKELALTPANIASGDVVWICGHASLPPAIRIRPGYWQYTTVEDRYLSPSCRQ
jgi:hypothetical protein